MKRIALVLAVGVALGAGGTAGAATPKLTGTVGPGFTISLKSGGKVVKSVKAGTYTVVVGDKSNIHNFRLEGPGVNKAITTVGATGTKTATVTLKKGTYRFLCEPHASSMTGTFKVV